MIGLHATTLFGAGANVAANVAGGAANAFGKVGRAESQNDLTGYLVDRLLRPSDPSRLTGSAPETDQAAAGQVSRIFAGSAIQGEVTQEDRAYLANLVAARTGLSTQDAQAGVEATLAKANEFKAKAQAAADQARKVSATAAILGALSLAIGAFIASVAGAMGGRQRDEDEMIAIGSGGRIS